MRRRTCRNCRSSSYSSMLQGAPAPAPSRTAFVKIACWSHPKHRMDSPHCFQAKHVPATGFKAQHTCASDRHRAEHRPPNKQSTTQADAKRDVIPASRAFRRRAARVGNIASASDMSQFLSLPASASDRPCMPMEPCLSSQSMQPLLSSIHDSFPDYCMRKGGQLQSSFTLSIVRMIIAATPHLYEA